MRLIITGDVLIDRPALSSALPSATAEVMAAHFDGEVKEWRKSYLHVLEDWDSYWTDLSLSEANSLAQWREGRWRVVRALFRLTRLPRPDDDTMGLHLDELPREIGRLCDALKSDAVEGLKGLMQQGSLAVILAPALPSALIRGMLDASNAAQSISGVIGPDELGQFGLDGIAWSWIAKLAGSNPSDTIVVGDASSLPPDALVVTPPADLSLLSELASHRRNS